jgi:flagellar protein FliS
MMNPPGTSGLQPGPAPNSSSAAAAYRSANVEHAPPLKLVQMLYEGALRFLAQAEVAHASADGARFQERCLRAMGIVTELRAALDPVQAPELAANLESLYLFAEEGIRAAMQAESSAPLAPACDVLRTLLDGWKRLEVGA